MNTVHLCIFFTLCAAPASAQSSDHEAAKSSVCAKPLSLIESRNIYTPHKPGEFVESIDGYGIYAETPVNTDSFDVDNNGNVNAILTLSALNYWISIRREFTKLQNLAGSTGIELVLHLVAPLKDTGLHVTVSDTDGKSNQARTFQIPDKRLKKINQDLVLRIPWKNLTVPQEDLARDKTSSRGLQIEKIAAYEITFFGKGTAEVRIVSVGCY